MGDAGVPFTVKDVSYNWRNETMAA